MSSQRGQLRNGGYWGCGRHFAHADTLGRYFHGETGRICIKRLLDEEPLERQQRDASADPTPNMGSIDQPIRTDSYGGNPVADASLMPRLGGGPPMPYRLPTAIMQQYSELKSILDTITNMPATSRALMLVVTSIMITTLDRSLLPSVTLHSDKG